MTRQQASRLAGFAFLYVVIPAVFWGFVAWLVMAAWR